MNSVLVADDERDVLDLVASNLRTAGFRVLMADDGTSALETIRRETPDIAILDVMMPGMTGLEICRALRSETTTERLPVILLTARKSEIDRIVAFELGADDYITKPFSPREVVLRVQAILRRSTPPKEPEPVMRAGSIEIDSERHTVKVDDNSVELTATEFRLLSTLLAQRGRLLTRDTLLNAIWGLERDVESRTVDTHLRRLRDKLGAAGEQIHTVRGFGYRLDEA